jgi:hypothetical protein
MTAIINFFGEETQQALIKGDELLILEMQVMAKAEKFQGLEGASVEYVSTCMNNNRSPWMQEKIRLLADLCQDTVMNFDNTIQDKLFARLQRQAGKQVCLYHISVWLFIGDDGIPEWTVRDSIEPGFARINRKELVHTRVEVRQRLKSIIGRKVG